MNFSTRTSTRRSLLLAGLAIAMATTVAVVAGLTSEPAWADLKGVASTVSVAQKRSILKALCEGNVVGQTCGECPSYSSPQDNDGLTPEVGPYLLGSFVDPKATEAYVSLYGCDYRFSGYAGSVLMRKTNKIWNVVRYDESIDARNCFRFPYETGTTVLACYGNGGGQGYFVEALFALYVGPRKTTTKPILSVQSNDAACRSTLDQVSFRSWRRIDLNTDAKVDLEVVVNEAHTEANEETCEADGIGKLVTHRIPILFDGTRFAVAPKALPTATCLDSGELGGRAPTTYCPKTS